MPDYPSSAHRDAPAPPQPAGRREAELLRLIADGEPVSGRLLADRLGVSRAAVWKQIGHLRALGLEVMAQAGAGYRLAAPVELLDEHAIRAALGPSIGARLGDLALHWRIDSTSSELLRRAPGDTRDRLACLSEQQSDGRGRRGRRWQMPLGGGLALSFLKRFDAGMAPLAGLSLVAGLAARGALEDCGVRGVGLKWPNDLVADGAKLGGVLVEVGGDAIGPCHAVIGIGLNLRLDAAAAAAIDQPVVDVARLCDGTTPSRNKLAAALIAQLVARLDRFAADGFAAFADEYARHDVLCGRRVQVLRGDHTEAGIADGIDARGRLRVAFADGVRSVDSGEVSVRGAP